MADAFVATISRAPILFAIVPFIVFRTETLLLIVDEFACATIALQLALVWSV